MAHGSNLARAIHDYLATARVWAVSRECGMVVDLIMEDFVRLETGGHLSYLDVAVFFDLTSAELYAQRLHLKE